MGPRLRRTGARGRAGATGAGSGRTQPVRPRALGQGGSRASRIACIAARPCQTRGGCFRQHNRARAARRAAGSLHASCGCAAAQAAGGRRRAWRMASVAQDGSKNVHGARGRMPSAGVRGEAASPWGALRQAPPKAFISQGARPPIAPRGWVRSSFEVGSPLHCSGSGWVADAKYCTWEREAERDRGTGGSGGGEGTGTDSRSGRDGSVG
jgi:hypothetical protein